MLKFFLRINTCRFIYMLKKLKNVYCICLKRENNCNFIIHINFSRLFCNLKIPVLIQGTNVSYGNLTIINASSRYVILHENVRDVNLISNRNSDDSLMLHEEVQASTCRTRDSRKSIS